MDQLGKELRKMVKAGLGAVATGAEAAQEAIESLARKGEPLYRQAKEAVQDTTEKIRQAMNACEKADAQMILDALSCLSKEDRELVRKALDDLDAREEAAAAEQQQPAGEAAPEAAEEEQEPPSAK